MADTVEEITELVERELAMILDVTVVENLRARISVPQRHLRNWDYGSEGEQFPCWTVVADSATDTAIVYSEHGFGPRSPWGLVSLSAPWFGMDSGWFLRLEDAFVDSFMGADLPIWNVIERSNEGTSRVATSSVVLDDAFRIRDALNASEGDLSYAIAYRGRDDEGVP